MARIHTRRNAAPGGLELEKPFSNPRYFPRLVTCLIILGLVLIASCGGGKKESAPQKPSRSYDLAGEWHSDIQSADRPLSKSIYAIEQKRDSVILTLLSTKAPGGDELVPDAMRFEAVGVWRENTLRLTALSWISGRDSCSFQVRGEMDKEGRLLLHFPADLCGKKSLPYTRSLYRPDTAGE
jgi:hypothetical protein